MTPELPVAETALSILAVGAVIVVVAVAAAYMWLPSYFRELNDLSNDLSGQLATLRGDQQRTHEEMTRLRLRLTELEIGVKILIAQVKRLGATPDWNGAAAPVDETPAPIDETALYRKVAELFDVEEIDDLAFRLGIAPDEIEGKRRDSRARHLVQHTARRGELDDLVQLVRQLRPGVRFV